MYTVNHYCIFNSPRPYFLNSVACVSRGKKEKKQATDAAHSGPGAGVRPHEWIDSCAGRTLQWICFCLQHATLWPYAHVYVWNCRRRNWALFFTNDFIIAFQCGAKCFMNAEFCCYTLLVRMVYFYLTEHSLGKAGDVLCKHFRWFAEAKTRAQLITNENLCCHSCMRKSVCCNPVWIFILLLLYRRMPLNLANGIYLHVFYIFVKIHFF